INGLVEKAAAVQKCLLFLGAAKQPLLDFKRAPLRYAVLGLEQRERFFERIVSPPLRAFEKLHPSRGGQPADGRMIDDLGVGAVQIDPHKRRKGMGLDEAISPILLAKDDCVEFVVRFVLSAGGRTRKQQQSAGDYDVANHGVNPRMSTTKRETSRGALLAAGC